MKKKMMVVEKTCGKLLWANKKRTVKGLRFKGIYKKIEGAETPDIIYSNAQQR